MHQRTCNIDGCDKALRAKGMCVTHYNRQQPNRHRKVAMACSACGVTIIRDQSSLRWNTTYCSETCRSWGVWKAAATCAIPADHWARWYGRASEWIPPLIRNKGECAWCGNLNERGARAAYCSERCSDRARRMRRRAREHSAAGEYTWAQVVRLWMRAGKLCAYCQTETPLYRIEPDHVIALARGGDFGITNILAACGSCNADKRELSLGEWAHDRERRGLPPVVTTWQHDDPRYKHLTSTLSLAA